MEDNLVVSDASIMSQTFYSVTIVEKMIFFVSNIVKM